jgi:hypothetical protein
VNLGEGFAGEASGRHAGGNDDDWIHGPGMRWVG